MYSKLNVFYKGSGFTLTELLIVVTLVITLLFVGSNSYSNSVDNSYQVQAQSDLIHLALKMQRHYVMNRHYFGLAGNQSAPQDTGTPWVYTGYSPSRSVEPNKLYTLSIAEVSSDGQSFVIKAEPVGSTAQKLLKPLLYSSTGERALDANNNGVFDENEYCWDCS